MYKYDEVKGYFVLGTKSEIMQDMCDFVYKITQSSMNSLVDGKLYDLDVIYNDLLDKNKIDEKTKNCIEDFVNRIHNNAGLSDFDNKITHVLDDEKFTDIDGKEHDDYKHYKISEIKLLLFNRELSDFVLQNHTCSA